MKLFSLRGDRENPAFRAKVGKVCGLVGIACNLLVVALKLAAGILSGAFSVVADGINNLFDAASAVVTLVGFKLAEKPADKDHPYGHARYEYLSGLAVAAMIVLVGFELLKSSVDKIVHPVVVENSPLLYGVLVLSVLIKLWMYFYQRKMGKYIASQALLATAADSRNDAITTAAILLSAVFAALSGIVVDGYVSFALSLFIMYSGVRLAKETISPLLGENADPELQRQVVELVSAEPMVLGYHDLMIHDYGPGQRFGSIHVEMDQGESPLLCHEIIDNLERTCLNQHNIHLVIHYDPVVTGDAKLTDLRAVVEKYLKTKNPRISIHDFRMVCGEKHTNLIFDMVLPEELMEERYEIQKALDKALAEREGKTYYTVISFDMEGFN